MCSLRNSEDILELVRIVGTHFSLRKWKIKVDRVDLNSSNVNLSSTGYFDLMSLYSGHYGDIIQSSPRYFLLRYFLLYLLKQLIYSKNP